MFLAIVLEYDSACFQSLRIQKVTYITQSGDFLWILNQFWRNKRFIRGFIRRWGSAVCVREYLRTFLFTFCFNGHTSSFPAGLKSVVFLFSATWLAAISLFMAAVKSLENLALTVHYFTFCMTSYTVPTFSSVICKVLLAQLTPKSFGTFKKWTL